MLGTGVLHIAPQHSLEKKVHFDMAHHQPTTQRFLYSPNNHNNHAVVCASKWLSSLSELHKPYLSELHKSTLFFLKSRRLAIIFVPHFRLTIVTQVSELQLFGFLSLRVRYPGCSFTQQYAKACDGHSSREIVSSMWDCLLVRQSSNEQANVFTILCRRYV